MKPGQHDFPLRRGDSATLAFRLSTRNLLTGERGAFEPTISKIEWSVGLPSGLLVKSTESGGGLAFDAGERRVDWVMTASETQALPKGNFPFFVRVFAAGGWAGTVLVGQLDIEG